MRGGIIAPCTVSWNKAIYFISMDAAVKLKSSLFWATNSLRGTGSRTQNLLEKMMDVAKRRVRAEWRLGEGAVETIFKSFNEHILLWFNGKVGLQILYILADTLSLYDFPDYCVVKSWAYLKKQKNRLVAFKISLSWSLMSSDATFSFSHINRYITDFILRYERCLWKRGVLSLSLKRLHTLKQAAVTETLGDNDSDSSKRKATAVIGLISVCSCLYLVALLTIPCLSTGY